MKLIKRTILLVFLFATLKGCGLGVDFVQEFAPDILAEITPDNLNEVFENIEDIYNSMPKDELEDIFNNLAGSEEQNVTLDNIPEFAGKPYVEINNNIPDFDEKDLTTDAYEKYSELDSLDRPGTAAACLGPETLATEERGSIGQIKPVGWHTVKYDCITDGMYLYNRCHLIGYQLCGTNFLADKNDDTKAKNLITGTRYLNVEGMLPFENMIADYIKDTGNHVILRVTPIYTGKNLLCNGIQMQAMSVEDNGEGICFNVYCYNCQPGVIIDYNDGSSREE